MANYKGYYTQSRIGEYFYPDAWGTPVYAALRLEAEQLAEKYRAENPVALVEVWETTLQCVSHCALEAQEDPVIVVDCYTKRIAETNASAHHIETSAEAELGASTLAKLRKQ